jgi:hypothetical protein
MDEANRAPSGCFEKIAAGAMGPLGKAEAAGPPLQGSSKEKDCPRLAGRLIARDT